MKISSNLPVNRSPLNSPVHKLKHGSKGWGKRNILSLSKIALGIMAIQRGAHLPRAQVLSHFYLISEPHNHVRALSRALRGAQIPSYSAGLTEQLTLNSTNIFNNEGRVFGVEDNAIVEVVYAEDGSSLAYKALYASDAPVADYAVEGDRLAVVTHEKNITVIDISDESTNPLLETVNLHSYLSSPDLEISNITQVDVRNDVVLVIVTTENPNVQGAIAIKPDGTNTPEERAVAIRSSDTPAIRLAQLYKDDIILSVDEGGLLEAFYLSIEGSDSKSASISISGHDNQYVDLLIQDNKAIVLSQSSIDIFELPEDSTQFNDGDELQRLGKMRIQDGAAVRSAKLLDENTLVVLKDFDKVSHIDISDPANMVLVDTHTLNHFNENDLNHIGLIDVDGEKEVVLHGADGRLYTLESPSKDSPPLTSSDEGNSTGVGSPVLNPVAERDASDRRTSIIVGSGSAILATADFVGLGYAVEGAVQSLSAPIASMNFDSYQAGAYLERTIPRVGFVKGVESLSSTATPILASLRIWGLLEKVSDVQTNVETLGTRLVNIGKVLTHESNPLLQLSKGVAAPVYLFLDVALNVIKDAESDTATPQMLAQKHGVYDFFEHVQEAVLDELRISDRLDNVDVLVPLEFDEGTVLRFFADTFSTFIEDFTPFVSGYSGSEDGSFVEEMISAIVKYVIDGAGNSRISEKTIEQFFEAAKGISEGVLSFVIENQALLNDFIRSTESSVKAVIDHTQTIVANPYGESLSGQAIKNIETTINSLVSGPLMFSLIGMFGNMAQSISGAAASNAHSAGAITSQLARVASQQLGSNLFSAIELTPVVERSRVLDTMALGVAAMPAAVFAKTVLDIEDNIAQNLDDSVEFMRIGADVLEELGDFAQESTDAIGGIYNATKNALNEMDLSDIRDRFVTFLEENDMFESNWDANGAYSLGTNFGALTQQVLNEFVKRNASDIIDLIQNEIGKLMPGSERVTDYIDAVFGSEGTKDWIAIVIGSNIAKTMAEDVRNVADSVEDLKDELVDPIKRLIELIAVSAVGAAIGLQFMSRIIGVSGKGGEKAVHRDQHMGHSLSIINDNDELPVRADKNTVYIKLISESESEFEVRILNKDGDCCDVIVDQNLAEKITKKMEQSDSIDDRELSRDIRLFALNNPDKVKSIEASNSVEHRDNEVLWVI